MNPHFQKSKLGHQRMLELYGCYQNVLNDIDFIRQTMLEAAHKAQATIVEQHFHQFAPQGISGTVIIAESHLNIHTWPEHHYAAIDIFTCSPDMDIDAACAYLFQAFQATHSERKDYSRGDQKIIQAIRGSQTPHHHQ